MIWLRSFLVTLCLVTAAAGLNPDELLPDPELEQRARAISAQLRCLVCQNQSIDDSDADLARDLRLLVRERLVAGDTDEQVRQYLVDRYGEYVLLTPRFHSRTILLWGAAPLLLLTGLAILVVSARRQRLAEATELSDEERRVLKTLE